MKKIYQILLLVLTLHLALAFPWRLAILGVEAANVRPGLTRVSNDDSFYWETMSLESKMIEVGYTVEYVDGLMAAGAYGRTIYQPHKIIIERALHWNERYLVLAHEAGHALSPAYLRQEPESEVFAEAVANLVCRCGYRENARYLASARGSLSTLFWYYPDIYRVAAFLR